MRLTALVSRVEHGDAYAAYGISLLRITLAALWAAHFAFKFFVVGMESTTATFAKLGYPAFFAWGTVTFEVVTVIAFLFGLYTRLFAVAGLAVLIPATAVWLPKGFWFTQGGYEMPLVWCVLQIILLVTGPGPLAIRTFKSRS